MSVSFLVPVFFVFVTACLAVMVIGLLFPRISLSFPAAALTGIVLLGVGIIGAAIINITPFLSSLAQRGGVFAFLASTISAWACIVILAAVAAVFTLAGTLCKKAGLW